MNDEKTIITTYQSRLTEIVENAMTGKADLTVRKYTGRLRDFFLWLSEHDRQLDKRAVGLYIRDMAFDGKAPSTLNGYLASIKAFVKEAESMGMIDPNEAYRIKEMEGVKARGVRIGNWLSVEDAQRLLDVVDTSILKGKRDKAILALMVLCGLRRSEIISLTVGHIQERDGHNIIADLLGKGGRVRTIKITVPIKRAINEWLQASGRELTGDSLIFVAMRKGGRLFGNQGMSDQAVYKLVVDYGSRIEHSELRPHDLRRTFAKLARKGRAELDQISFALGHSLLTTTQKYLGTELDLDNSPADAINLRL